jgi:hypothetical protein
LLQLGLAHTWSAFQPYLKHHGEEATAARLQRYKQEMMAALGVPDEHTPVRQVWPVEILLARRPMPLSSNGTAS